MATNAQEQTGWGLSDRLHTHGILLGAGCPCTHPLGVTPITATGTQGRCAMGAVLNTKHFFKHRSSWNLVSHMSSGPHKCWPKLVQNWHILKLLYPLDVHVVVFSSVQTGVVSFCLFSKIIPSNALGLLKMTMRVYQLWMKKALPKSAQSPLQSLTDFLSTSAFYT